MMFLPCCPPCWKYIGDIHFYSLDWKSKKWKLFNKVIISKIPALANGDNTFHFLNVLYWTAT